MHSTRGLAAAVAAALTLLAAGCSQGGSPSAPAATTSPRRAASAAPAGLPSGITALGSSARIADQGWDLAVAPFSEAAAPAGVPKGWIVMRTSVRFTNTGDTVATLPETVLTVRYGALGEQAIALRGTSFPGLPAPDQTVKKLPGSSFTARIGVAVPPQAQGRRVTVTAEATQEGLAEADDLFYEGTLPGTAAGREAAAPGATAASEAVLRLGAWSANHVRLSPITVGAAKDGERPATAELTVTNTEAQPRTGLGISLRVMTGTALSDAASLSPGLDYPDAPIAPLRSATVTIHFDLPATAVPGPVTVEATDLDSTRVTFTGSVG